MARYRRLYVNGGTYFFTVNLFDRNSSLLTERIDLLREVVAQVKSKKPFNIDAWVVLPNHLHTVWTLPQDDSDYSARWREIKKRFSNRLAKTEPLTQNQQKRRERGIWQRRFWEHTILDDEDYRRHIDYVHLNPFKHGLVHQVADWPYSTFHKWVEKGVYPRDWCGECD